MTNGKGTEPGAGAASGAPTGQPLRHAGMVSDARFDPAGRRVVTASGDGSARVWDAATGRPLRDFGKEVVAAAIRAIGNGARPSDIVVVGDTPHDVTSALANGVVGVGVATGKFTVEELRDSGAALVYQDFADWQAVARELVGA